MDTKNRNPQGIIVNLDKLKELNSEGKVFPHNLGPTPDLAIKLFETNPDIWRADLLGPHPPDGSYSMPSILAREKKGHYIMDSDIRHTIKILGEKFYGADAIKIQAGAEFGGLVRNRPKLIFLWWD